MDSTASVSPRTHYHIRWSQIALDWERFNTREEAELSATGLVRPHETYTIEAFDETCAQCGQSGATMAKEIGRGSVVGGKFQAKVSYQLYDEVKGCGGSIEFLSVAEAYAAFSNDPDHRLVLVLGDGRKLQIMYIGGRASGGEFRIIGLG